MALVENGNRANVEGTVLKRRKWLIVVVVLALVGAGAMYVLNKGRQAAMGMGASGPEGAPIVRVAPVSVGDLTQEVLAPGTVEASGQTSLRAPFNTKRVEVLVHTGDKVTAGQVIAELDAEDLEGQLATLETQVVKAELSLTQLLKQKELAPLQMDQKLLAARNQVNQAEQAVLAAAKQGTSAGQKLEQARSHLAGLQARGTSAGQQVDSARERLTAAEAEYRAKPADAAARQAFDAARTAYEEALRRSTDEARQLALDLAQAETAVKNAEQDLAEVSTDDSPAMAQARDQLQSARLALEIAVAEAESGGNLMEQIRLADLDLASARRSLAELHEKIGQRIVKAPSAGVVLAIPVKEGQPAQQGAELVVMGALDPLRVSIRVDEIDIGKVEKGQELSVRAIALPQDRFTGRITQIAAQVTSGGQGGFFEVIGEVKNTGEKLRSGMSGEIQITAEKRTGVLVVGLESVREEGDQAFVPVVKDYVVEMRPVKLGLRTQAQVEVLEGLSEGEEVVFSPFNLLRSLKDGDKVRIGASEPQQLRGGMR